MNQPTGLCENCLTKKAEVVTFYGAHQCKSCESKIAQQCEEIRDLRRKNLREYGNTEGSIDRDEYWGRKK